MGEWTFVSVVGLAFLVWFVLVFLFTPRIDYQLTGPLADEVQLLRGHDFGIDLQFGNYR